MRKIIIATLVLSVSTSVLAKSKEESRMFAEPTKGEKRLFNITRSYLLSVENFCQDCAAKAAWLFVKQPKSKCAELIAERTLPANEQSEGQPSSEQLSNICVDAYDAYLAKHSQ